MTKEERSYQLLQAIGEVNQALLPSRTTEDDVQLKDFPERLVEEDSQFKERLHQQNSKGNRVNCPGKRRHRRTWILLVALLAALGLIGAGIYYEMKTFHMDGTADQDSFSYHWNQFWNQFQKFDLCASVEGESVATELTGQQDKEAWRYLTLTHEKKEDGTFMSGEGMSYTTTDADEMSTFLVNSELSQPDEVPDGYQISQVDFSFYLTYDLLEAIPISSIMNEEGVVTEVYEMPDAYQDHISMVNIIYENEEGKEFTYEACLTFSDDTSIGASGDAVSETLLLDGYLSAVCITEPAANPDKTTKVSENDSETNIEKIDSGSESGQLLTRIYAVKELQEPVLEYHFDLLGYQYRKEHYGIKDDLLEKRGFEEVATEQATEDHYMLISVSSEDLTKEELEQLFLKLK